MSRDIFGGLDTAALEEVTMKKMAQIYGHLLKLHEEGLVPSESVQFFQIEFINLILSTCSPSSFGRELSGDQ